MRSAKEKGHANRRISRLPGAAMLSVSVVGAMVLTTVACDSTQKAADRGELCAKVVKLALFNPFPSDAEKAERDVRKRADELDRLSDDATDDTLRKAIETTADSLREARPKDHGPRTVVGYLKDQNDRLTDLRKTCLDYKDF
jgi:alkyl sulfatase BDS1-like metallo-beta-lactamase superfamily hydrolase